MARSDALMRLMTDRMSALKFDFDALKAPPLASLISVQCLNDLRSIAVDPRLASKPKERRQYVRSILGQYGFIENGAGTNRICFRHCDVNSIVIKVAIAKTALVDNLNEFMNQRVLKPFVCKCFETTQCGTIGLFEKVDPITTKEQFKSIAPDVFDLLVTCFDGRYILEDVGSNYYLNYGIRHGFGPVLLDYAYMYEIDPAKLKCWRPDPNSPTGTCDGELDQDIGFNNIVCTKCGKKYIAKDLQKKSKPSWLINNDNKGELNMKIALVRGNQEVYSARIGKEEVWKTASNIPVNKINSMMDAVNNITTDEPEEKESHASINSERQEDVDLEKASVIQDIIMDHSVQSIEKEKFDPNKYPDINIMIDNPHENKGLDFLARHLQYVEMQTADSEETGLYYYIYPILYYKDFIHKVYNGEIPGLNISTRFVMNNYIDMILDNIDNDASSDYVYEYNDQDPISTPVNSESYNVGNSTSMNDVVSINPMFSNPYLKTEEQPNSITVYSEESVNNTIEEENDMDQMQENNIMKGNNPDDAKDADVRFVTGYEEDECEEVEEPESDNNNEKDPYIEETSDIDDEY